MNEEAIKRVFSYYGLADDFRQCPVMPLTETETLEEMLRRIVEGTIFEVSKECHEHFFNVLPPRFIHFDCFFFAEGHDPWRIFWEHEDRCYTAMLSQSQTERLCHRLRSGR